MSTTSDKFLGNAQYLQDRGNLQYATRQHGRVVPWKNKRKQAMLTDNCFTTVTLFPNLSPDLYNKQFPIQRRRQMSLLFEESVTINFPYKKVKGTKTKGKKKTNKKTKWIKKMKE